VPCKTAPVSGDPLGGTVDTSDTSLGLRLADALPTGPVGREVVSLLTRVEDQAPKVGYYAAMAEAAHSLRQLRSLHSRARRFVGDALHNIVRLLRRLRALAQAAEIPAAGSGHGPSRRASASSLYAIWLFEQLVPALSPEPSLPSLLSGLLAQRGLSVARLQQARLRLSSRLAQLAELAADDRDAAA